MHARSSVIAMAKVASFAESPTIVNMPGRTVNCGVVYVKNGNKSVKKRYLRACCGGQEEQPAKLELYEDVKAANKGKTRLTEIIFTKVKRIVNTTDDNKRLIVIEMHESDGICFYSDVETEHKKWVRYCGLLSTIPNYSIPEEPKYNLVPQEFIDKYTDPGRFDAVSVWVVYIINEDVGKKLCYEGLHIIAIRRNSTMNIHNFHSGKHLLSWDRDKLRRSGCIGSLVFMEAGRRCLGGPGLLWMCCPVSVAAKFRECLHNFLFYGPEDGSKHSVTAPPRSNSMSNSGPLTFDSGLNSVSPSHSVSDSHLSSSQIQSKLNGDSGVNMSPPPINLKTHPSLRRRSNDSSGSVAHVMQRSVSHDISQASSSSQLDDDLQFSCGRETPGSNDSDKSDSNEQLDEGFRTRAQQLAQSKEQYEFMRHPSKPRTESAPPAPTGATNYVHMNPSGKSTLESRRSLPTNNYVNHVIPADMKKPVENYENTGFNAMRTPPIPAKGIADNLITIKEGAPLGSYENHTLPENTYVNNDIRPPPSDQYENTSPHSSPPSATAAPVNNYQNITLDPSASPRMNTHEKVVLKKTERKNSVKDHSGSLQYSEVESGTSASSVSPPRLQRQYSDIDYNATMAVEAQQRQRTIQKEHAQQMKVH